MGRFIFSLQRHEWKQTKQNGGARWQPGFRPKILFLHHFLFLLFFSSVSLLYMSATTLKKRPCCKSPCLLFDTSLTCEGKSFFSSFFSKFSNTSCQLNAPVKVNPAPPPPPHPGTCGALVGLYHHIGSSLSPQHVGDSRVFLLLSWGMWGISRGFVLIQDGGVIPTRTSGNISAHGSRHKCS